MFTGRNVENLGRTLITLRRAMTMILFAIGIIEMVLVTAWTKVVTDSQIFASGVVTMVHVLIWYYVLQQVTSDISNWQIALNYAFGCALGTSLCTWYFQWREARTTALRPTMYPSSLVTNE